MKIINITYYQKKQCVEWGMNIYTDKDIKFQIPFSNIDDYLKNNITKLSTRNILYLRKLSNKKIPMEILNQF